MRIINRNLSKRILEMATHFPSIAILGARQVGKTTLVKSILEKLPRKALYLDLELESDLNKLENAEIFLSQNKQKCIVLDEIQRKADIFPVLRALIDQYREPCRFILLGSAHPLLLKLSSESLAGRIVYTELTGFNFTEIGSHIDQNTHWMNGGFPEPLLTHDYTFKKIWYDSFIRSYVEHDIPMLGLSVSPQTVLRCLRMVAHSTGQILNKSNFSRSLGSNIKIISQILNYFENTFITRRLEPYFVNIKKRLVKSPKIYIRDSGLLHSLLGLNSMDALLGHPILGHSWESFVTEQIISVLENDYDYNFFRTQDGAEADLVIGKSGQPLACVEMKFTSRPKRTKSLTTAIQYLKTSDNFIIIPQCSDSYQISKDIAVCSLNQFIKFFKK